MGRRSVSGGVCPAGAARIQFTFKFEGVRYRPTLRRTPTEANLRRAREQLVGIKARIASGTFSFAEEFPGYVYLSKVPRAGSPRTCGQVFDDFLEHCAARVARLDMAAVTLTSYRRVLNGIWRSDLGATRFLDVRYSTLVQISDRKDWSKKSYNNALSVLRRAFKFGYRDYPDRHDPTREMKGARIQSKDRPAIDPFTINEAETLLTALRRDWGDAQANYDEFRFFTGLRPSEQIALLISDFDAARGTLCHQGESQRPGQGFNENRRGPTDFFVPACDWGIEAPTGTARRAVAQREDRSRLSILHGERRAAAQSAVSVYALAADVFPFAKSSVPQTVRGAPHIGELGPHDRPRCAVGRAPARPQHRHDAALLRRLGAWGARDGHCGDPSRRECGATDASAIDPARASE
jgi:hypothetical protein